MAKNEDIPPQAYTYAWSKDSDLPLQDFLTKYKPSMVQNDGSKPWIWVKGSEPAREDEGMDCAVQEATTLLKTVTEKVANIKNDASIPTRSNKKTGAKSKKEVREQVQAEATERLKEIAIKHGFVSGKWLIFASPEKVDVIWSSLATSLVSGPLASTSTYLVKVATSPQEESANYQHILCLYLPDVYDKKSVTEAMRILLRNHGVTLSGVKSNMYTAIGVDSKHASGIQSTTWKNSALLKDSESKELKDAYFAELATSKTKPTAANEKPADEKGKPAALSQVKPKPKKVEDDPFASDDDHDEDEEKRKQEIKSKRAGTKSKRPKDSDEEEEGDQKQKKKRVSKK